MAATRVSTVLYNSSNNLGASMVLANVAAFSINYAGHLSIQCIIDNGAGGTPTDAPIGVWKLYASSDGTNFSEITTAATELTKISAVGNTLVDAYAIFSNVPGSSCKLVYTRTSGGGTSGRARVNVTVW